MREEEPVGLPNVGHAIGNWRIICFLGDGRSGTVFKVRETCGERRIGALKIFKRPFTKDRRRAFENEASLVERQIIPGFMPAFYGKGRWHDIPFFVMQFADAVPENQSRPRTRRIMDEAAKALGQLHARHYLHCDVKRENLGFIDGHVVLLDFGSARPIQEAEEKPARVGTWVMMAPEVREKIQLDVRSDIYSLGATLSRICSRAARRTFDDLILHATANDPDERPQTINAFRRELNTAQDRLAKFHLATRGTVLCILGISVTVLIVVLAHTMFRQTATERINREYLETESNFATALSCIRKKEFDKAYHYLKPIAESRNLRSRQAQRLLKDLSYHESIQGSENVQSGSPTQ